MNTYLDLALTFMKISASTFGGGYAMMPLLERELAERRGWVTIEELHDYFAVGQCTPGIIAVNVATFVGMKLKNIPGAIAATAGIIIPPLFFAVAAGIIAGHFLRSGQDFPEAVKKALNGALKGITLGVCALATKTIVSMIKTSVINKRTGAVFILIFALAMAGGETELLAIAGGLAGLLSINNE